MGQGTARSDRDRPAARVDCLDCELLGLVICYLAARSMDQQAGPDCEVAWDRFYRACDPLFRTLANRRCGRCWNLEDRVQELWRVIIERLRSYDPARGSFPSWLSTVLHNALTDQDRASHILGQLDEDVERQLPTRDADPSDMCEQAEVREIVEAAVESIRTNLPETTYRILHDHWVEGKSYEEIGASLGLAVKVVRDRHNRAIGRLRSVITRRASW
jgi:RNA polymerase sigma factor (sigma-70 family)